MNKMTISNTETFILTEDITTKDMFIREFAKRTNFTLEDTRYILDVIIGIFEDAMRERLEIKISGFLHLTHSLIKPRMGNRPIKGKVGHTEKIELKESTRSNIKISQNLRELSKSEIIETQEE